MCGVALADWLRLSQLSIAFALVGFALLIALAVRRAPAVYLLVSATFFCLHTLHLADAREADLARLTGPGANAMSVSGVVTSEPKISARGVSSFMLATRSVEIDGAHYATSAPLLCRWKGPVRYGDEVSLFGTVAPIAPRRNPGEFDMRAYLRRQNVTRQLTVGYPENGHVTRHTNPNWILAAAHRSRNALQAIVGRGLEDSPEIQAAIAGMALGIRHQTADDIEEPFQQTGTLHLFAVAGLHVGIVAQLLWIVCRLARISRKWSTIFITLALLFYSAVTGLHTSSVRAAIMAAVLLSGFFVERKVFALNSLAAAAVLLLWWDTNELFAIGFQLSFAVVGAIILLAEPTSCALLKLFAPDAFLPRTLVSWTRQMLQNVWRWIARGLSVSFAAWAGSFVLMAGYYNLITPVSLVANLAVVPIAFFVLAGALLSIFAAPFSGSLSLIFNNANWLLTTTIFALVRIFAATPGGHWYVETPRWPEGARIDLTALDVGTGGAIHLRTAHRDWLLDTGRHRDFERTLQPYLRSRGTNGLDLLLLSHADAAHVGGGLGVIESFAPGMIVDSAARSRSVLNRQLSSAIAGGGRKHQTATACSSFRIDHDVTARVLFPPANFESAAADDQALVVKLLVGDRPTVLMMSDSGEPTERALLASGENLRADVLIKGQNRSSASGTAEFLDAVRPQVVVATSNDFPDSERVTEAWAADIRARGIRLFRQDETGAVRMLFWRGGRFEVRPYLGAEIFRSTIR